MKTLSFLSEVTSVEDKKAITCVVLLSDKDEEYNLMVKNDALENFKKDFDSGFFQIILVDKSFYPKVDDMKFTFNDAMNRIQWRTKQVFTCFNPIL